MMTADRLRQAIKDSRRSISEISDAAGVPRQTVYSFVSGQTKRLRSDTQIKVEKALISFGHKSLREDPAPFDHALRSEAISLGLDPDAIAKRAVENAVKRKRMEAWIEDNREAMQANAQDIRKNGLWSDGFRQF